MTEQKRIESIFKILQKQNPNPQSELTYPNEYCFAVAVILSAQSTDVGVNKATPALFKKADSPEKMVALGVEGLQEYIKTIGLFRNKSKNVIKMSQDLIDKHESKLPQDRKSLMALGGIGGKTASVIRNQLWNKADIAVDTHVYRLAHRLDLVLEKENTADKVAKVLPNIVPTKFHPHTSDWLVLHGRYVCTARKPKCSECLIKEFCHFDGKIK